MVNAGRLLNALVANMSPDKDYALRSGRWYDAVRRLKESHERQHPELFEGLHFRTWPEGCHSSEVDGFLTMMRMGDWYISVDDRMRFNPAAREAMQQAADKIPERYREPVQQMARELEGALAIIDVP